MPGHETPMGRIEADGRTGGERYNWQLAKDGTVIMAPWFIVEPQADNNIYPPNLE